MPNNLPLCSFWKVLLYLVRYSFYAISWKVDPLFNNAYIQCKSLFALAMIATLLNVPSFFKVKKNITIICIVIQERTEKRCNLHLGLRYLMISFQPRAVH
jgi:hypothetical protein